MSCSSRSNTDCIVTLVCRAVRAVCTLAFSSYYCLCTSTKRTREPKRGEEDRGRGEGGRERAGRRRDGDVGRDTN